MYLRMYYSTIITSDYSLETILRLTPHPPPPLLPSVALCHRRRRSPKRKSRRCAATRPAAESASAARVARSASASSTTGPPTQPTLRSQIKTNKRRAGPAWHSSPALSALFARPLPSSPRPGDPSSRFPCTRQGLRGAQGRHPPRSRAAARHIVGQRPRQVRATFFQCASRGPC